MASSPDQYTLFVGDAHDLPGYEAISGWDHRTFSENTLLLSSHVASIPDYPECVVRVHPVLSTSPEDCLRVAEQGLIHYTQLEQQGIALPAQRLTIAPAYSDKQSYTLYGFTERLEGYSLTESPDKSHLSEPVIESAAGYVNWALDEPSQSEFLWDIGNSWQYTAARASGAVLLHDVDLNFQSLQDANGSKDMPRYTSVNLDEWAHDSGIKPGPNLRKLLKATEPMPSRMLRRIMNTVVKKAVGE